MYEHAFISKVYVFIYFYFSICMFQLLFPQNPEQLTNIPAMCSQYIVLGICEDWKKSQIDEILRMIAHHSLEISIIKEVSNYYTKRIQKS